MIRLRRLQPQDAPLMLEWMHDPEEVAYMRADFAGKTLEDCRRFIAAAAQDRPDLHRAAAGPDGVYLGTVSLKHIDDTARRAEFAISMRQCAHGSGQSARAMQAILRLGFTELGLRTIYWCVDEHNVRARRFYQKQGYAPRSETPDADGLLWYEISAQ